MTGKLLALVAGLGVGAFLRRRYHFHLSHLILWVLLYMLLVAASCALVFLEHSPEIPEGSRPLRTRPPIIKEL